MHSVDEINEYKITLSRRHKRGRGSLNADPRQTDRQTCRIGNLT